MASTQTITDGVSHIQTHFFCGFRMRSTDDKIRSYGSRLGAGLMLVGSVIYYTTISATTGSTLVLTGTLILITSLFKVAWENKKKTVNSENVQTTNHSNNAIPLHSVMGRGDVIKKRIQLDLSSVKILNVNCFCNVNFIQQPKSKEPSIELEGEEAIVNSLSQKVEKGNQLTLDLKPSTIFFNTKPVIYTVMLPEIDELNFNGSGSFETEKLKSESFKCSVSGSGVITLKGIEVNKLSICLLGMGHIYLNGRVEEQTIVSSGMGSYNAQMLSSKYAVVKQSGSGKVTLNASEKLNVDSSGSGDCVYYGIPKELSRVCTGTGKIYFRSSN